MKSFFQNSHCINMLAFLFSFMFVTQPVFAQYSTLQKDSLEREFKKSTDYQKIKNLGEEKDKRLDSPVTRLGGQENLFDSQSTMIPIIRVHVVGDVSFPGVYSTKLSTRASEIIQQAQPKRDNVRLFQIRKSNQESVTYDLYQYYYHGNLKHSPYLSDGDVIFIPKQKATIQIEGPVQRPGFYELSTEKDLSQIISLAGGFSSAVSKVSPLKVIRFTEGGNKYILDVEHVNSVLKRFSIEDGDIIIVPDVVNSLKKFDYSVETIPGENLIYPTSVAEVFVIGSVDSPGPYPYKSHLTAKDYVGFAGANSDATFSSITVLRDGKKKRQRLSAKIQAGDVLIVREKSLNQFVNILTVTSTILSVTLSAIVLKDVVK